MKQLILELPALVMVESSWKSKLEGKVIEDSFRGCFSRLVGCGIDLCETSEMVHYDQNILIPALAALQMQEVNRYQLEGLGGSDALHWGTRWLVGSPLLKTGTLLSDIVFNVPLHVGPVKSITGQADYPV